MNDVGVGWLSLFWIKGMLIRAKPWLLVAQIATAARRRRLADLALNRADYLRFHARQRLIRYRFRRGGR